MERTGRDFFERSVDMQEAILLNIPCERCQAPAKGPLPPVVEYEEDGHIYVEATCARCARRARVDVADVP